MIGRCARRWSAAARRRSPRDSSMRADGRLRPPSAPADARAGARLTGHDSMRASAHRRRRVRRIAPGRGAARRAATGHGHRRPVDRIDGQHRAPQGPARLRVRDRHGHERAAHGRAHRSRRRRVPPGRRRRREADRRSAGAHDRDERARHRGRAQAREQEGQARRHLLDVGGLRQEHGRAVPRGRRPGDGPDAASTAGRTRAARRSTSSWRSPTTASGSCRSSSCGSSTRSGRGRPAATAW